MAIKSQKFLPSAELRASKKTISTSLLRDLKSEKPIEMGKVSKEASLGEKFGVIFQFLKKEYKRNRMSWFRERKRKQEERRKKREEELEKNKGKSKIGKGLMGKLPFKNIFDSVGNFLLFLAGGFLFNKIVDFLPQLMEIGKIIKPIIVGIYNFGKFMTESVIGFIDAGYAIHDSLRQKVEDLGGEDAVEKFEKFTSLFKKVINGAIILALISTLRPKGPKGGKPCPPCPCPCKDKIREPFRVPVTSSIRVPSSAAATVPQQSTQPATQVKGVLDYLKDIVTAGTQVETNEKTSRTDIPLEPAYASYSLEQALEAYAMTQIKQTELMRYRNSILTDTDTRNPQRAYASNQRDLEASLIQASQLASRIKELDPSWSQRPSSSIQWGAIFDWAVFGAMVLNPTDAGVAGDLASLALLIKKGRISYAFLGRVFGPKFVEFMKNRISGQTVSPFSNVNRSMSNSLAFQPDYTKSTVIFKTTKIQPIIQQQYSPLLRNA